MCTVVCFVLKILHCRRWVTEAVTKTQGTQCGYQRCEHDSSRPFSRWPVRNKSSICLNHRVIIVKISSRTWSWSCCYICVNHSESTWKERVDLVTLRQLRKYWVAAPSQPPSFLWKPRGLWVSYTFRFPWSDQSGRTFSNWKADLDLGRGLWVRWIYFALKSNTFRAGL